MCHAHTGGGGLATRQTPHQPTDANKRKGKKADLYSAFIEVPYTQGAQVYTDHTVLPANYIVPASIS